VSTVGGLKQPYTPSLAELLIAAPGPGEPDRLLPGTFDTEEEVNTYREEVERALVARGMQEWWCIAVRPMTTAPTAVRGGTPESVYVIWLHAYTDQELADLAADRAFLASGGSYGLRQPDPGRGTDDPGMVRRRVAI
jgi:hypothetical protein